MQNATFGDAPNTFGYSSSDEGVLSKATAGAHAAVNSVADAADGAASRVKPAIDQVAAMAHQVVENTAASAAPATDWLGEQVSGLKASEKKLVTGASTYIATNPLKSLGLAVLAGFLVSRLIQR